MAHNKSDQTNIKLENTFSSGSVQEKRRTPKRPRRITEQYLHNSGLFYLERFAASKNHFKTVMLRKVKRSCLYHTDQDYEQCAIWVGNLADRFEDTGILNDTVYLENCVTSMRRRGLSRSAILRKMKVKGIAIEDTARALDHFDAEYYNEHHTAERLAALKLGRKKRVGPFLRDDVRATIDSEEEQKQKKRILGAFARAGFSYDVAMWVMHLDYDDYLIFCDETKTAPLMPL